MLGIGRRGPLGRDVDDAGGGGCPPAPEIDERDAWAVLGSVEGVGPVSFGRLVGSFGGALPALTQARGRDAVGRLVAATASEDGPPTLSPEAALALVEAAAAPSRILDPIRRAGLRVLTLLDDEYPSRLRRIELPPPILFVRGDVAAMERRRAVAIVGTRRPTGIGRATADRIGDAVAALGATVVSGLALGVDGAAHAAAVRAGIPTVAVIGGGHARLYPASHAALARSIVAGGGVVVSEFAPWTHPTRGTFPRRNRLISGLADATVVVEAGARSGALTTAAWALEQGRGLHIVPGRLDDPSVAGSLAFLRENGDAKVVAGIPELLEDLGLIAPESLLDNRVSPAAALGTVEGSLVRHLVEGRGTVDELVEATGQGSATVLAALTSLEMRGLVLEAFGRYRVTGTVTARTPTRRSPSPAVGVRDRRPAA